MKRPVMIAAVLAMAIRPAGAQWRSKNEVSIGVLGLFHTQEIVVSTISGKPLDCRHEQERFSINSSLDIRRQASNIVVRTKTSSSTHTSILCDDGQGGNAEFTLSIPQKISRRYQGRLVISSGGAELLMVVRMDLETAVASVVAAESPPNAPLEALKAQAVAARSYLAAGRGRHRNIDFCDTTHCQFLREPPSQESPAARATAATRGLELAYKDQVFAAMYSASCGGHTHSLEELGIAVRDYPYFAVNCDYCIRHPEKWVAEVSEPDASTLAGTESSRLNLARKLGWKTIPSNSYSAQHQNGAVLLEGVGKGHGIGLCQRGAADMARHGASFREILEHYYPNTTVKEMP
ncbi:MAG TPA: SpoIID/LytB domain-containing protein [Candidatus Angelobacter sp.]|nr:SpoIID/LytB domain-containing protein [Candidatus Angelobacter sp.]